MGTCDYCGNGIANICHIKSADGKQFRVGCDCVNKVYQESGDASLTCIEKQFRREVGRERRRAKAEERRQAREKARQDELQAQRERNGGLTDREVEIEEQKRVRAERASVAADVNGWIIDQLMQAASGSFVDSMIDKLGESPISDLSERQQNCIADIVGKVQGRRNSKAYNGAYDRVMQICEGAAE
jgi:hypothetical protein